MKKFQSPETVEETPFYKNVLADRYQMSKVSL